jgi:mRNA interferase MazF
MIMKRGEIFWADLNPTIGSEISKIRPVLIVSNDINNQNSDCVTILPITSATSKIYPFEVFISKKDTKLDVDSKIKANQIRTIDKSRLIKRISILSENKMGEVSKAIMIHLDLIFF